MKKLLLVLALLLGFSVNSYAMQTYNWSEWSNGCYITYNITVFDNGSYNGFWYGCGQTGMLSGWLQ